VKGAQMHLQKFLFVENPGKIPENSGPDVSRLSNEVECSNPYEFYFFPQKMATDEIN